MFFLLKKSDAAFSLKAMVNFDAGQKALQYDNAGYGISVDESFPAQHQLQAFMNMSFNSFFGDKTWVLSDKGRQNKNADIYSIQAGLTYFFLKRFSVSFSAGPAWHAIHTIGFSENMAYQPSVTWFPSKSRRLVTKLYFTEIPKEVVNIQYVGLGVGYRFF